MQVKVYNREGKEIETIEISDSVFGLKWNASLVHQVVTSQLANRRSNTAHAKTRGEVSGGGKKPWRQKGTGRARHGSIRSPIWKGGGVSHGPRNDRDFTKKINKKMARKALLTVLSAKARDNEIILMDEIAFSQPKTKEGAQMFTRLSTVPEFARLTRNNGVLVALKKREETSVRALKNLSYASIDEARNLNASEVLKYKYLLMSKAAVEVFQKVS